MEDVERWESLPSMSSKRRACAAAAADGTVMVFGGLFGAYDGNNYHSSVEAFDVRLRTWTSVPSMMVKRSGCAAAGIRDRVFVCGGKDGSNRRTKCLSSVEAYDIKSKTWTSVPSMRTERSSCAAAAASDMVFVCGGRDGRNVLSSVEAYDVRSSTWISIPPLSTKRSGCAAAAVGDEIFVCGGSDGGNYLSSVEAYDVRSGTWRSIPSMSTKRFGCTATAIGDAIVVAGGIDDRNNYLSSTEVYNVNSKTWTSIPSIGIKRCSCAAVAIEGWVYILGGWDGTNTLASVEAISLGASNKKQKLKIIPEESFKKSPRSVNDRVKFLEEQLSLENVPPAMMKRVEYVETSFFGEIQKGSGSLSFRISRMEEERLHERLKPLEEQLALENVPPGVLKRIESIEISFFGEVQKGTRSLIDRTSRIEKELGPPDLKNALNISERVERLEEQLALENVPSPMMKRVENVETYFFGEIQEGPGIILDRISRMEEELGQ